MPIACLRLLFGRLGSSALGLALVLALALPGMARQALAPQDGPPETPLVVGVDIQGLSSYSEHSILSALGITLQQPLRDLRVREAFETFGIVVTEPVRLEAAEGGVIMHIKIAEVAVDPEVQFLGVDAVSIDKVREWAGLGNRTRVYIHEADRIASRLKQAYKKQGYLFVEIQWAVGEAQSDSIIRDLIFNVMEGPKVRCLGVDIRGNDQLPETGALFWKGGLRKLAKVQTRGKSLFNWFGKIFDEDTLEADLQAMRQVYRDRGWLDAKVEIEDMIFNKKRNRVRVKVLVDEGPLYTVDTVGIEAFTESQGNLTPSELSFSDEELLALCNLRPGVPLERARFLRDRAELGLYYGDRGYLDDETFATQGNGDGFQFLDPLLTFSEDGQSVAVTYRIVEGRPRYTRAVHFEGNTHTRDRVLRREVSVLPGELLSQRELEKSRRRLINTSYFDDPSDPSHPLPDYRLYPIEDNPDQVDVVFTVEEGRNVDLRFTGGIDSNSGLVGIVSLSMRNFEAMDLPTGFFAMFGEVFSKEAFHGNGESFSLNISPGSEVDQWSVDYTHPDVFGTQFDRTSIGLSADGRGRRYRSHDEDRNRTRVYFSHLFDQGDLSLRLGGVYQNVKLRNFSSDDLPTTLLDSPTDSSFHGVNLELRWSALDNNSLPRRGQFFKVGSTFFGSFLGGDNDLIETEIAYDYYAQFGPNDGSVLPGVHLGVFGGVASPYGDTEITNYSERFFGGGSRHLRGFRFRGVGPFNGDYPLGAETMVGGTVEYRYPLYTTPIAGTSDRNEVFRLITFMDWGIYDPSSWSMDTDELRASAGFGIGMLQPIPMSIHLGWPLREFTSDQNQIFSFSLSLR
ncbi:MAG TPA: BamA/TamA family outer membrane protein [Planctomycetota bacterium]|nr:BamA/TamA family outer membrane protein [Planctomycetota bacterium]